jgi:hypothetical protein
VSLQEDFSRDRAWRNGPGLAHGFDAFFEQGGRIATIDVSLQEKESLKADVLLLASFDKDGGAIVGEEEAAHAAAKIAERLNAAPLSRAA